MSTSKICMAIESDAEFYAAISHLYDTCRQSKLELTMSVHLEFNDPNDRRSITIDRPSTMPYISNNWQNVEAAAVWLSQFDGIAVDID